MEYFERETPIIVIARRDYVHIIEKRPVYDLCGNELITHSLLSLLGDDRCEMRQPSMPSFETILSYDKRVEAY